MLSQADINTMEMAHTHAQAVKKDGFGNVFIGLFKKYMDGRTLSKLEERAIKDYLRVYRSEFATLKKKLRLMPVLIKLRRKKRNIQKITTRCRGLL